MTLGPYPGTPITLLPITNSLSVSAQFVVIDTGAKLAPINLFISSIPANSIPYSAIQIETAHTFLGNPTSTSGNVSEITVGNGLAFSGNSLVATGTGQGTVTQISTGSGLTGGPITSFGTLAIDIGNGLAFSGNQLVTSGGGSVDSVFGRAGIVVAVSGDYFSAQVTESGNLYYTTSRVNADAPNVTLTGQNYLTISGQAITVNAITLSGTNVTGNLPFVNIQSASPSVLLGNPTAITGVPSQITLGGGLGFSGTTIINLSGGIDGVSSVAAAITGSGLSVAGSPITGAGTLTFSAVNDLGALEAISTTGYGIRTAADTWVARPLSGAANRIDLTNSAGIAGNTVIDVSATYTGQNTINTVGTLTSGVWSASNIGFAFLQSASPTVLLGNPTGVTGTPSQITLGANLSFSGTTLVATGGGSGGAGTVTQISSGTGLTGGPITSSGTLSFASIIAQSLWANVSTATAVPIVTTLGNGLAFSGTTLIATGTGAGTVTNILTGTGLTGGPITSTGTVQFSTIAPSSLWANVSTATSQPVVTTLGAGLAFSGATIINTSGTPDGVLQISTGTGLTGGPITSSGTVSISNNGVGNLQLAVGAVTNTSITAGSITATALAANAVVTTGITNAAVTYAKIQNESAVTLLGNPTGGAASPSEITLAGSLAFSGTTLTTTGLNNGTVTNIIAGSGLTGGPITNTGTLSVVLGSGLAFSGNQIINTSGSGGGSSSGVSIGLVYAFAAGNLVM